MCEPSVFLAGDLPPCPERFNAAAYCLGADVPPDKPALIAVDPALGVLRHWSFAELRRDVARAAGAYLDRGARPGDRVALLLGDVPEFPIAYFGAIAAGLVATPLSSQLSDQELKQILEVAAPSVVVGGTMRPKGATCLSIADLANGPAVAFPETAAQDPALLIFTSGSSGVPKGVLHAHRSFWARQSMHAGWHDIGPADRVLHAGAFNWTFTLGVGLADAWSKGATAIVNAGARTPDVWPMLAKAHAPTVFAAAPGVFRRVLKYGTDLGDAFAPLRHAVTAGERLVPSIRDCWQKATGKPLLEALGMSEVSTFISVPPTHSGPVDHAGWPQPGRHVAVLDEDGTAVPRGEVGVLCVDAEDPGLMLGYWQDEAGTRSAFSGQWFLTGDLVRMRTDGAIEYLGRRDDRMNAQGYRVDPSEVEAVLLRCPGVAECGVTELPVSDGLSVIAAWVVLDEGCAIERPVLEEHMAERLAAYKAPRAYFLAERLPQTPNGKLMRRALPDCEARML